MTRALAAGLVLTALLSPAVLSAKWDTALIELRAPTLVTPIRSSETPVREFNVWSGMGTNQLALQEAEGFIANWKAGPIAEPGHDLPRYDVLFYGSECAAAASGCIDHYTLTYVVTYAHDSLTGRGYVYFPGSNETLFAINGPSIWRGPTVEGRWFRTTTTWDRFAATLLGGVASKPN
jgi:hypothetical protein